MRKEAEEEAEEETDDEEESRFDCMDCSEAVTTNPQTTMEVEAESHARCLDCYATHIKKHAENLLKVTMKERDSLLTEVEELENKLATATNKLKSHEDALDSEYKKGVSVNRLLKTSQKSGQILKDALLTAEQDKIALQLRIAKLEEDVKTNKDEQLLFEISRNRLLKKEIEEVRGEKESLLLKMKCVEGERDEYKYQLNKSDKENKRLHMLLEEAERSYSSDE
jgi:hypothetical protein